MLLFYARAFIILVAAVTFINGAFAQTLRLRCVQQSRQMCEQGQGCKALHDAAPNQWAFSLEKQSGKVMRCAGRDCGPPFDVIVRWAPTGEVFLWEPVANEAFAVSPDRREFSHSLTAARGTGGHIVSEFGHCMPGR
jgi:hypothetical protein